MLVNKSDYEFLLKSWKELADNLIEVNEALSGVIQSQQKTILKLQGVQTEATQERKES